MLAGFAVYLLNVFCSMGPFCSIEALGFKKDLIPSCAKKIVKLRTKTPTIASNPMRYFIQIWVFSRSLTFCDNTSIVFTAPVKDATSADVIPLA